MIVEVQRLFFLNEIIFNFLIENFILLDNVLDPSD